MTIILFAIVAVVSLVAGFFIVSGWDLEDE
jgi:hypothetical protein